MPNSRVLFSCREQNVPMKFSNCFRALLVFATTIPVVTPVCYAEIYKWVDANGQTHYSERNTATDPTKAVELKPPPLPGASQSPERSAEYWQEQERQFRVRQLERSAKKTTTQSTLPVVPPSLSRGKSNGTDVSRCFLAKDVLNGAVVHKNGAPTDAYDRQVAENDVRASCR